MHACNTHACRLVTYDNASIYVPSSLFYILMILLHMLCTQALNDPLHTCISAHTDIFSSLSDMDFSEGMDPYCIQIIKMASPPY